MDCYRTRSVLLSTLETAAEVISECRKALKIGDLRDLPILLSGQFELDRHDTAAALGVLLRALKEEAALSAFGALVTRWDIAQRLANLRRFRVEETRNPEIVEEHIESPIVITGLPRSGTTFLQNLLAEDPESQALRCWQVIYPYADAKRPFAPDKRSSRFERQIHCFNLLSPDLHKVHPLHGSSLQECTDVMAHVFQSLRFDSTYHVPSYRKWLDAHGHHEAYHFHRRFLQHLQHQDHRGRWVLKAPDHVFALDALKSVYPDARVVFLHRDPMKVLPSNAQLIEILRSTFTKRIDPVEIGRQNVADWALGADLMVEANQLDIFPPEQMFHLHFLDLVARPMDAVERLYRHFRIGMSPIAKERISRKIAGKPDGGYAKNVYPPKRHGIDAEEIGERFRAYMNYFDIRRELRTRPVEARGSRLVPAAASESPSHAVR